MRYFLRLGWKNVLRQPLRTSLALGAIGLAVAMIQIGATFAAGMEQYVFQDILRDAGELIVAREDWFERSRFNPLRFSVRGAAELRERLLAVEGVRAAVARIDFGLMAQAGEETEPIGCQGVDVEQFARYSNYPQRIVAGRWLKPEEKGLLLGKDIADRLGVRPGDTLTVLGKTAYDSFTADDFLVVGVFDTGLRLTNRMAVMPLGAAQEFLEMPDSVTRLLLYGDHYEQSGAIAGRLRVAGLLPQGVAVRPWTEDPFLGSIYRLDTAVRGTIVGIICFVAGLGILNMMMVSVLERRREIGVMMALGMSRAKILGAFLYEALLYGLLGSAVGLVLGAPVCVYLERVGLNFRMDEVKGIPFALPNTVHGRFGLDSVLIAVAIGVLLSLLGMLWPMLKTFGMRPSDAMARR